MGVDALGGSITDSAWRTKPSWYLVATEDRMIPRQPSGPCPSGPAPPWSRPPAATPSTSPSRPRWLRSSSSRPPSSKRNRGPAAWAGRISRRPKLLRVGDPDLGRSCHLACSTAQARATKAAIRPAPTTSSARRPPGWPPRAAPSWSSSPAPTWPTSPNPQPWPMPCAACCDSAAEPRHPIKHQPARAGSRPPITPTSKGAQSRAKVGNTLLASLAAKAELPGANRAPGSLRRRPHRVASPDLGGQGSSKVPCWPMRVV